MKVKSQDWRGIVQAQKQWVNLLGSISVHPPVLTWTWRDGITPGKRISSLEYPWEYPYQYREILLNELPFDLDVEDYDMLVKLFQPVIDATKANNIPMIIAGSGGSKSVHGHIFFKPTHHPSIYSWKEVRLYLWNYVLDLAGVPEGLRGNGMDMTQSPPVNFPFDRSCANYGDDRSHKVIRDFGGMARGKKRKSLVPELARTRDELYSDTVTFPDVIELWDATDILDDACIEENRCECCRECPVDLDWSVERFSGQGQYPDFCRKCGSVYNLDIKKKLFNKWVRHY